MLSRNPAGVQLDVLLIQLAEIRGISLDKIRTDYQRFDELRLKANRQAEEMGKPVDQITKTQRFWGHNIQLQFGKVVGDALGKIDPVFGALLSPTGGMTGPGDTGRIPEDPKDSVKRSLTVFHDAGGYLRNYQGGGPGYTFSPGATGDPTNPLNGIMAGNAYFTRLEQTKGLLEKSGRFEENRRNRYFTSNRMY
jgi:hypothetical protein